MKSILFVLLFLPLTLFATYCIPNCNCRTDWTLELRGAYYHIPSKTVKNIYSSHWIDYQVEAAKRVHPFIEVWGGVCWAYKQGNTTRIYGSYKDEFKDRTRMYILPISLGLKGIYSILPCVDIYAGAGVCYSFLKIKNFCKERYSEFGLSHSPFKKAIYRNQFGGVFKIGVQFAMSTSTFLDIFVDYNIQSFHMTHKRDLRDIFKHDANCSGFKVGAGFGVYF